MWGRSGDFILLRWFGNPATHELYNRREDLSETTDLAAKQPEKVKELDALIDGFLKDTGATSPARIPPALQRKLRPQNETPRFALFLHSRQRWRGHD